MRRMEINILGSSVARYLEHGADAHHMVRLSVGHVGSQVFARYTKRAFRNHDFVGSAFIP